jgi:hypothetical protein
MGFLSFSQQYRVRNLPVRSGVLELGNAMRWFGAPARKLIIIWSLGILAAAICFGALESTGSVDRPGLSLGGAFVGFIVTVVVLDRIWREERPKLDAEADDVDSDFLSEEVVKVFDFRRVSTSGTQTVDFSDYYRIKKHGDADEITFHYATTGELEPAVSLTHPQSYEWKEIDVTHTGGDHHVLVHEHTMTINLQDVAPGQVVPIITQLAYKNAFTNPDNEWLETHIDRPTGRLGILLILPSSWNFKSAEAQVEVGRSAWKSLHPPPAIFQQGTILYWSIDRPVISAKYQVKWRWNRNAPRRRGPRSPTDHRQ